jgi:hypothetical protein
MEKECQIFQAAGTNLTPAHLLQVMIKAEVYDYSLIVTSRTGKASGFKVTVDSSVDMRLIYNINFKNDVFDLKLDMMDTKDMKVTTTNSQGDDVTEIRSVRILYFVNKLDRHSERHHRDAINIAMSMFDEDVNRDDRHTIRLLERVRSYTNPQSAVGEEKRSQWVGSNGERFEKHKGKRIA